MTRLIVAALAAALIGVGPGLAACSGSSSSTPASSSSGPERAVALLARAKTTLDAATAVHFALTSADVPAGANALYGGEGDAVRPSRFAGDLDVVVLGTKAKVSVISIGGKVYAKLPFAGRYDMVDPKQFNIPDPGAFMSTDSGVTQLLGKATNVQPGGDARVGTSIVQLVTADLPGEVVARVLVSADPTTPVKATFGIESSTGRLLQAKLIGPFFRAGVDSTYTLVLSRYGEHVDVTAPIG